MRKLLILLIIVIAATAFQKATAQCSVCTRTAQQLGEKPAKGMNAGILYLAFAPFAIAVTFIIVGKRIMHRMKKVPATHKFLPAANPSSMLTVYILHL